MDQTCVRLWASDWVGMEVTIQTRQMMRVENMMHSAPISRVLVERITNSSVVHTILTILCGQKPCIYRIGVPPAAISAAKIRSNTTEAETKTIRSCSSFRSEVGGSLMEDTSQRYLLKSLDLYPER